MKEENNHEKMRKGERKREKEEEEKEEKEGRGEEEEEESLCLKASFKRISNVLKR